ncbi:MAG TPA: MOSC N-terminal beta barrel domain-containing protein [Solirubrobacteraceae bacterium]
MRVVVSGLSLAAVKATRLREVERIRLERDGVRENRRFFVVDERGRMISAKRIGSLQTIVADYSDDDRILSLTFPDGRLVTDRVRLGEPIDAHFFSRAVRVPLVQGPWSEAISELAGQPLRLVESDRACGAVDRGDDGTVSLISRASLARLAEQAGRSGIDSRRFRMLIEIDGVPAHTEDEWVGGCVAIGSARVTFKGHVGRCLITSRDPDSGIVDLPTLDLFGSYRSGLRTTEPLPFGVYGVVREPGTISVGDEVVIGADDRVREGGIDGHRYAPAS